MKKKSLSLLSLSALACFLMCISCSKENVTPESQGQLVSKKASSNATATVDFTTSAVGKNVAMDYWAVGTHGASKSIEQLGSEVDVVRVGGFQKWPMIDAKTLSQDAQTHLDSEVEDVIKFLQVNPNAQISLSSSSKNGKVNSYFISNGKVNTTRWKNLFKAVRKYTLNKLQERGYSVNVAFIEANNEPDWNKIGDKSNMNSMMAKMQADSELGSIPQVGPSTLNCANAKSWWNATKRNSDWGATHVLGGNMKNYISFIKKVNNEGKPFYNSEAHTVAEMIVAARYGCKGGLWWYPVSNHEAGFTHAQFGNQILYKEVRENWAVAAAYKGEGNKIHLFVSSAERFGNAQTKTTFTFNCTDQPVSFDGSEKKTSHTVSIGKNDTEHIIITW